MSARLELARAGIRARSTVGDSLRGEQVLYPFSVIAPPPRVRGLPLLFGIAAESTVWPGAVRAAVAFGIPALVLTLMGREVDAMLVASGSVAVVYGERRPYRSRWLVVLGAGLGLTAAAWCGAVSGIVGAHVGSAVGSMIPLFAVAVVAVIAVYVVAALRLGPPGAFFFVVVCALSSYLPAAEIDASSVVLAAGLGVVNAVAVSMCGALWAPHAPEQASIAAAVAAVDEYVGALDVKHRHIAGTRLHSAWAATYDAKASLTTSSTPWVEDLRRAHTMFAAVTHCRSGGDVDDPELDIDAPSSNIPLPRPSVTYRLRRSLSPVSHATTTAVRVLVAALLAGSISVALGLERPDWAVLSAVLVLQQGPDRTHGSYRGLQRLGGTVVGVGVYAGLHAVAVPSLGAALAVMALLFAIELTVPRNYGLAVVFITPFVMMMGSLSHPGTALTDIVADRIVETSIGVLCALTMLWLLLPRAFRRTMAWSDIKVLGLVEELSQLQKSSSEPTDILLVVQRDLHFELLKSALAAAEAAYNDPAWTHARWERHAQIDRNGYALLAQSWTNQGNEKSWVSGPDTGQDDPPQFDTVVGRTQ